jgi:virginiamycin B lyase
MNRSIRNVSAALAATCLATAGLLVGPRLGVVHAQDNRTGACAAGCISEYTLPPVVGNQHGAAEPFGISAGADGQVWFSHGDAIGRITLGGAVRQDPIPTQSSGTGWMHLGPDRAIWFAERFGNKIGRIAVDGRITEYPILGMATCAVGAPGNSSLPQGITTGSDGALWFTEECGNRIGRITLDGQITEYPVPTPDSHPLGITAGPDGALWFVEKQAEKIGRITTTGQITEFKISSGTLPQRITAGPDGALWFAEIRANKIGRITTDGQYTEYPAPGGPVGITTGPDGALWFAAFTGNAIGRMTMDGHVTEYPIPTASSGALQIAVGPDAALWFTETNVNQIGRLQIPGVNGRGQIMATTGPGVSASFTVSFSSAAAAQGFVNFGSGPGCSGLVEVGTQDFGAGTAQHTVTVTGNDLPGTVGDVGLQPDATYWYEVVTVTRNGTEIDNNGGKCYSVTIPSS